MNHKRATCFLLSLTICVFSAHATAVHAHKPISLSENIAVAAWANEEVMRALELGFGLDSAVYQQLLTSMGEPVNRGLFSTYISRFIAFQEECDEKSFINTVLYYMAEKDRWGQFKSVFSDMPGDGATTALYYLGVVTGSGGGLYEPNDTLTRQEAATFLARIYKVYGGELSKTNVELTFTDAEKVAAWATEGVAAMTALGIMKGYEDGRFAPDEPYSHEQCLLTLLRMYEILPISRKNDNVKKLFTYEQYMAYVIGMNELSEERNFGTYLIQQIDSPVCTFVEQVHTGGMSEVTEYSLIYQNGGMKIITDFGVCDTGGGLLSENIKPEGFHFSEDGKVLYCTITLKEDVKTPNYISLFAVSHRHEAGIYQIIIDVETLNIAAVKN